MIVAKDLRKSYKDGEAETVALDGVSFTVRKGEFMAIMGPSGSGKSTLLHVLGLLDEPTSGHYGFNGKDTSEYSRDELADLRNREVGFVFQAFNLLPRTSVLENVKLPLYYSGIDESEWENLAKKAVEDVGLGQRMYHEQAELSGGEKQRVAIARALVTDPEVIFADEPTGNLDSKSGKNVMSIIQHLNEEHGKTIVLITHETSTAEHSERIIRLLDGKIESDEKVAKRLTADDEFVK
ncbi:ABC transporter ATP-binding protein [Patescibacteria group bacterium]|nr:ABC transporter ATP-binding protein [Patescibacteria group bacterium]MDE1946856.1 ABC transporter ATP-binding protein [Patescibacteria group bacterium]MDE2010676.1 ABC transporter ATP-binding protein [Patescibacteria group bacterium]MDE2232718.1 ABC transporter ATP-binding protein [Patescibacteria group bacterium]